MPIPLYNFKERNYITLILLILLGGFILYSIRGIFGALLGTVVMYTIFRPLHLFLLNHWQWRPQFSAIFIIVGSFIVIVLPFLGLGSMVLSRIESLQENPEWIKGVITKINEFAGTKLNQPDLIANTMKEGLAYLGKLIPTILGGAASVLLSISVMYFLLYFMFIDHANFESGLLRFSPFREENAMRFGRKLRNITYSNVLGQGLIAIIQGSLVAVGYLVFGFADPFFWGVISTILAFIPVVGAPIVFVPASVLAISQGDTYNGIGMLLFGLLVISNIDNVLRLVIAKRVGNIHPIITIIGVIIGIPVFGIMGLVYGPLLISYFVLTIRIYETDRMAEIRWEKRERENALYDKGKSK